MSDTTPRIHPAIAALVDSLELGEPRIHDGLGLWPVFVEPRPEPHYITLVEALPLDGFRITEVSELGSVPALRVVNETAHQVLLFDGEELRGAKQNRILNASILVAAGSTLDVPVSCTERGRWSHDSPSFSASEFIAHPKLRAAKSRSVRESLQARECFASDQAEVWAEVDELFVECDGGVRSPTSAMRDAYHARRRELEEFSSRLPCLDGQCGLAAVIGERVVGVDVLSRPEGYGRLHRRLVESHAMDFLLRGRARAGAPADPGAPGRFLAEVAGAEESVHPSPGLGEDHRLRFRWGCGSALRVGETTVHLALFGDGPGRDHHPAEPRLRRRRAW